jgi:DNA gyrase inhibitor GyrI/uncharacterized protein YndB with AHSA1/START domain
MRWVLGLVLAVVVGVAARAGVGHFLLKNTLEVSSSVVIERPRATVYTLVSHLRLVQEWSPYRALDPEAEYLFSGEDGEVGQSMRWRSTKRSVGDGAMTVLEMTPNERVAGTLDLSGRARLASAFLVEPAGEGTRMTWQVSGACDPGWVNIPCRYMNLVIAGAIKEDLDAGLSELQRLADELPTVDFGALQVEIVSRDPQRYVFDDIQITAQAARSEPDQVAQAMQQAEDTVNAFLTEKQLTPDSRNRVVVTTQDDGDYFKFRVGYIYSGPSPIVLAGVEVGETPSGRMARVVHEGTRAVMADTYAQLDAYLQTRRINRRGGGLPWEVYVASPGGETLGGDIRVEIYVPVD